ncbi:Ubiquitin-associated protein 1 [Blyttiomyces sp. JEL0837]|nr:Ubiquitin-associated protein 1 [Blyttiomyces sp. JEL0837]
MCKGELMGDVLGASNKKPSHNQKIRGKHSPIAMVAFKTRFLGFIVHVVGEDVFKCNVRCCGDDDAADDDVNGILQVVKARPAAEQELMMSAIQNYQHVHENIADIITYTYQLERTVIQASEKESQEATRIQERKASLEKSRIERRIAERRAKAPGLSNDNEILQPIPAAPGSNSGGKSGTGSLAGSPTAGVTKKLQDIDLNLSSPVESVGELGKEKAGVVGQTGSDFGINLASSHLQQQVTGGFEPPVMPVKPVGLQGRTGALGMGMGLTGDEVGEVVYPSLRGGGDAGNPDLEGFDDGDDGLDIPEHMQAIFETYESMGFSADAIRMAMKRFGNDEAKYLDYLVAYSQLISERRDPSDADLAVSLFHGDTAAASNFIDTYSSLCELGFSRTSVLEALQMKNFDRDAALDYLVKNSDG